MLALGAVSGCVATDPAFSPTASYSSDLQTSGDFAIALPDTVEVLPGKSVFEVKPRTFNKGVAIRSLMECAPFRGRRPVFLGDDVTDESAFRVMPEFGGFGFSVGRTLPGAQGFFATPREVRHWLYGLLADARVPV